MDFAKDPTVRFVQRFRANVAIEFPDGKVILLTHLSTGQHATVLQLPAGASAPADQAMPNQVRPPAYTG